MYMYAWVVTVLCVCLPDVKAVNSITITLPGNIPAPPIVSVIDGHNLTLTCHTSVNGAVLGWSKVEDPAFHTRDAILAIERIRIDQRGKYACTVLEDGSNTARSTLDVNVLWGPHSVRVDGPNDALQDDVVVLNCSANASPEPSYFWSYNPDGVPIVGRGHTFKEPNFPEHDKFYCFVENTLIPTKGTSMKSSVSSWKRVRANMPPHNLQLSGDFHVTEGSTFDQFCTPYGFPTPIVWWTKSGDYDVINDGYRMVVPNIQRDFDGYYTCHAENNVTNAAGMKLMMHASKNTYIHVLPKGSTTQTDGLCPTVCKSASNGTVAEGKTIEKACSQAILGVLALGWILVAILLIIVIFFFIRTRNSHTPLVWSKHHQSTEEVELRANSDRSQNSPRRPPELPKRPNEGDNYQPTYMSLRQSSVDRGNPDGSNLPPDELNGDGYITPNPQHGPKDVYIEPYSTSSNEKDDPSRSDNSVEPAYDVCT